MRFFNEIQNTDYEVFKSHVDEFREEVKPIFSITDSKDEKVSKEEKVTRIASMIANFIGKYHDYAFMGTKSGVFIRYWGGVWIEDVINTLTDVVQWYYVSIDIYPNKTHINLVIFMLQNAFVFSRKQFETEIDYINFHNGLYNIKKKELTPHRKTYLSFIQLPWDYKPDAKCDKFDDFLEAAFDSSDMIELIWEMIGYIMTYRISMQKAFILTSQEGGTGKSALIDVIVALIGVENVSKVPLDAIANNRFAKSAMAHKLLNYFTDLSEAPNNRVENKGVIKDTITDIEFDFEPKGMGRQKHKNIIKLLFSCNGLPYISDIDHAFARRWVIIDMVKKIEKPIENWADKEIISNKEEMEGIVRYAIDGLLRLYDRGSFKHATADDIMNRWRSETDIIYKFVTQACEKTTNSNEYLTQTEMFMFFQCFLEQMKKVVNIRQNTFTSALNMLGYPVGQAWRQLYGDIEQKHYKIYVGLKIKADGPVAGFKQYINQKIKERKEGKILKTEKRKEQAFIDDFEG